MKKRNANVELIRVIACLIVIGVHTCLSATRNGEVDLGRLFLVCLFADGVAIFWFISGFFMFNGGSYRSLIKRTIKHIVIPMALLSIVMFYFGDWLIQGTSLLESVQHSKEDYINVVTSLIKWTNSVSNLGYLWYLYAYLMIIAIFPLLRSFVVFLDEKRERTIWFMAGTLAFLS